MRDVRADPRLAHVVLEQVVRHPQRRVRDDELRHPVEQPRALGRVGQRARALVQRVELRQVEARVVLLARRSAVEQLHEVLGVRIVGVPAVAAHRNLALSRHLAQLRHAVLLEHEPDADRVHVLLPQLVRLRATPSSAPTSARSTSGLPSGVSR